MDTENSSIFIDLLLILAIFLGCYVVFHLVLKKLLKVDRKIFSNDYVNDGHKKLDRMIRLVVVGLMVIGFFVSVSESPIHSDWFLQPWFWLIMLVVLTEIVRAIMEWKYVENRNAYKFTAYQLLFIIILLLLFYVTNFFGRL